ncbi:glycoside hydrolase family 3 protein [Maribacter sp. HTCC2170]|uniref:glycoside hydrolase family 3 protein n=1 Tax=Maribacter sp. (strain HTCC2170 / KCCM 42371) TaxID=313603 RepID=UPI00006B49BE|nr:glycoside hydrolase family 3 N-terminal domain-containing protein [Maribacter sp. HTCC2170]EAR01049.1 glycosyl hydrolase, family 3 [Maribacter sp. HTCC2170]
MNKILDLNSAKSTLSKQEKIGQLFMPAAFINDTEEEIQAIEKLITEHHVGGLCFFHSRASAATNYEGKKMVIYNEHSFTTLQKLIKRYQKASKHRLLMAIDAEWGLAMRIENTPQYPYAITLGAIDHDKDLVFQVGRNIAHDCKQAGIHYNLSPVSDINNNPDNPVIGYRSFGENKFNVALKSIQYIKGMQSEGIASSVKHFPGHGDTAVDSHLGLPQIDKSKEDLLDNELSPFIELIKENVDSIMVGHLSVPALSNGRNVSSSISKEMISGLLRKELGFKGVVISDALNMHAVSKNYPNKGELEWLAFDAGNDILCFAEHIPEGIKEITLKATETQIESAFERVWKLKEKTINADVSNPSETINPDFLNQKIAQKSITLFSGSKENISEFRETGFLSLSYSKGSENEFVRELKNLFKFKHLTVDQLDSSKVKNEKNILLSIFPPQVKPTDNFGFTNKEIELVNELINTKNVVLYLFGNPYALGVFDYEKAKACVLAYQDFKVFQQVAANHFAGSIIAEGKMPVTL